MPGIIAQVRGQWRHLVAMADRLRGLSSDFAELVVATAPHAALRDLACAEMGSRPRLFADLSDAPCMQMPIVTETFVDCG